MAGVGEAGTLYECTPCRSLKLEPPRQARFLLVIPPGQALRFKAKAVFALVQSVSVHSLLLRSRLQVPDRPNNAGFRHPACRAGCDSVNCSHLDCSTNSGTVLDVQWWSCRRRAMGGSAGLETLAADRCRWLRLDTMILTTFTPVLYF
jgi:hypothetical protein